MKQTTINKINKNNILNMIYEPNLYRINDKGCLECYNRYSVLEYNGNRKQIIRKEFYSLAKQLRKKS